MDKISLLLLLSLGLMACDSNIEKPKAPTDQLYYPLGLVAHPYGRYLYVNNSIFDRKYEQGYLVVVDTYEKKILPNTAVRTGLFSGSLRSAVIDGQMMLYTPIRENNSLLSIQVDADVGDDNQHLNCGQTQDLSCSDAYITTKAGNVIMPKDPFDLQVDGQNLYMTHIRTGEISVWQLKEKENETENLGFLPTFNCQIRLSANANYVWKHPKSDLLYITDRFGLAMHRLSIENQGGKCHLKQYSDVILDTSGIGAESRGLANSADASLLYVASGVDRSIKVFDIARSETGSDQSIQALYSLPVGLSPNQIKVVGKRKGENRYYPTDILKKLNASVESQNAQTMPIDLFEASIWTQKIIDEKANGYLLVSSFDEGKIFVIDPTTRQILKKIKVGFGTHEIVVLPDQNQQLRAYVTNFQSHSISIIDLEPNSTTQFQEIGRIPETSMNQ